MTTDAEAGLVLLRAVVADHDVVDYDDDSAASCCRRCEAIETLKREEGRRQVQAFLESVEEVKA